MLVSWAAFVHCDVPNQRAAALQEVMREDMQNRNQEPWKRTAVRCMASSRADERPLSFLGDEGEVEIQTIRKSWREPEFLYFHVETKDGRLFDLRHHEFEDFWEVRAQVSSS